LAKVKVEYAENAQEIEESEPRVGETNSGVTAGTRFKSTGTRTETALFCNGCLAVGAWRAEPTDRAYIELGNLAGNLKCWYFWGRGGLHSETLLRVIPEMLERLQGSSFGDLEIVRAGSGARKTHLEKQTLVAIPLLKVVAAAHGETSGHPSNLLSGPVESVIAAPKDWCPNPGHTSCLRVQGNSMTPLIQEGYILAVDSSQNDQITVERKNRYRLAQRHRFNGVPLDVSITPKCSSLKITDTKQLRWAPAMCLVCGVAAFPPGATENGNVDVRRVVTGLGTALVLWGAGVRTLV
jgi:hypothetical protein